LGGVSYAPDFYALFCVFELYIVQPKKKIWAIPKSRNEKENSRTHSRII
jgi:hypothetical protein